MMSGKITLKQPGLRLGARAVRTRCARLARVLFILMLGLSLATLVRPPAARAQDLSALARVHNEGSFLRDQPDGAALLRLELSQAVPWRVFTLDSPRRLVLDFNAVDWNGFDRSAFRRADAISDLRAGALIPGWSRMVLELNAPFGIASARMDTSDPLSAVLEIRLVRVSASRFAEDAGAPEGAPGLLPPLLELPDRAAASEGKAGRADRLTVMLDPGHGGIDPGAERYGVEEADLVLAFARQLKELLLRSGRFRVVLTREDDRFVPLEARVSAAHAAGADLFISLHADALAQGRASGATVYTLSDTASDIASQKLAERHDRSDLLAGVDLSGQDDAIARVLMDMARTDTTPRSEALAEALVAGLRAHVEIYKHPHLRAGFSVLKAPDTPSVLIELGFLSSRRDRKRLLDPAWRAAAAAGIMQGIQEWADRDEELAGRRLR